MKRWGCTPKKSKGRSGAFPAPETGRGKQKLKKKYSQKGFEYLSSSHAQQGGNTPGQGKILTPKGFTTGCSKKNTEGRVWFVRQFFLSRARQPLVVWWNNFHPPATAIPQDLITKHLPKDINFSPWKYYSPSLLHIYLYFYIYVYKYKRYNGYIHVIWAQSKEQHQGCSTQCNPPALSILSSSFTPLFLQQFNYFPLLIAPFKAGFSSQISSEPVFRAVLPLQLKAISPLLLFHPQAPTLLVMMMIIILNLFVFRFFFLLAACKESAKPRRDPTSLMKGDGEERWADRKGTLLVPPRE